MDTKGRRVSTNIEDRRPLGPAKMTPTPSSSRLNYEGKDFDQQHPLDREAEPRTRNGPPPRPWNDAKTPTPTPTRGIQPGPASSTPMPYRPHRPIRPMKEE